MATVHPILQAFEQNQITLNEARVALGFPFEPLPIGMKYKYQLVKLMERKASSSPGAKKDIDIAFWQSYFTQLNAIIDQMADRFEQAYRSIIQAWKARIFPPYPDKKDLEQINKIYGLRSMATAQIASMKETLIQTFMTQAKDTFIQSAILINDKIIDKYGDQYKIEFDLVSEEFIDDHLPQEAEEFAKNRMDALYQEINELANEILESETPDAEKFQEELKKILDKAESRSGTVAITETTKLANLSIMHVIKKAGFSYKSWVSDDQPCAFCKHLHGVTKPVEEPFLSEGILNIYDQNGKKHTIKLNRDIHAPPFHPHCHCFIIPHDEEEGLEKPWYLQEDEDEGYEDEFENEFEDDVIEPEWIPTAKPATNESVFNKLAVPKTNPRRPMPFWEKSNRLSLEVLKNVEPEEFEETVEQQRLVLGPVIKYDKFASKSEYNLLRHYNAEKLAERMKQIDPAFYEEFVAFAREMKREYMFTDYNYRGIAEYGIGGIWEAWNLHYNRSVTCRAIQRVLKDEMGLTHSNIFFDWEERDEMYYQKWKHVLKGFLQHQYQYTQEYFDKYVRPKGINSLLFFRGEIANYDPHFTPGKSYINQNHKLAPMSSFTTNLAITEIFAYGSKARLYTTKVPLERILSFYNTGFGVFHEEEWLVLGPSNEGDTFYTWDWGDSSLDQMDRSKLYQLLSDLSKGRSSD
jgi:Phage Mu protein F like protein